MKKNLIFIFALLLAVALRAQPFNASVSDVFTQKIGDPILHMKNGITVFHYDDVKLKKMILTIFDKNHQTIVKHKVINFKVLNYDHKFISKHNFLIKSWEDNGNSILVYIRNDDLFYRITLNSNTAEVEKEDVISEDMFPNYNDENYKDKSSGNILSYNATPWKILSKSEALKRKDFSDISTLNFTIVSPTSKQLQKFPFDYLNNKYQYAEIMSCVFNNDMVYIISKQFKMYDRLSYDKVNGYKRTNEFGSPFVFEPEGSICFTKYDTKTQKFSHIEMYEIKPDFSIENAEILINSEGTLLDLKFIAKTESKNGTVVKKGQAFYEIFFQPVDISNMKLGKSFSLPEEKMNEFAKTNCNMINGYEGGMLDRCIIDKQGNLFTTKVKNVNSFSELSSGYVYTPNPEVIGISYFDINGKEIFGAAYPYNAQNPSSPTTLNFKNNFNYKVISGSKSNFIFLNNSTQNFNLPLNQKPTIVQDADKCIAVVIEVTPDGFKQYYAFGEPKEKNVNRFMNMEEFYYFDETDTYIIKIFEGQGYDNTRIAWVNVP